MELQSDTSPKILRERRDRIVLAAERMPFHNDDPNQSGFINSIDFTILDDQVTLQPDIDRTRILSGLCEYLLRRDSLPQKLQRHWYFDKLILQRGQRIGEVREQKYDFPDGNRISKIVYDADVLGRPSQPDLVFNLHRRWLAEQPREDPMQASGPVICKRCLIRSFPDERLREQLT